MRTPDINILEAAVVGPLDYEIIEAGLAADLFDWLRDVRTKMLQNANSSSEHLDAMFSFG